METVSFEGVSKRYNLGLTRTSLPSKLRQWMKASFRGGTESVRAKSLWALRDVSFELLEGQSLALIGPNGAGKTTILKLLASITKPTKGLIKTNGQLSALIELGAGFHPDLTGRDNIFLNGAILGLDRGYIERRFDEIVSFAGTEDFVDTPVKRYSSGMKVRLGFAVASSIEPDILLVDEVLAVGDASFRQKCVDRIQALISQGTSIIFVSHNLWLAQTICSAALYLEKGQVKFSGPISKAINLYDRALNERRALEFRRSEKGQDSHSRDVEITKVQVLNASNRGATEIANDEMAEVQIHYLAYKTIGDLPVVLRIVRSDGLACCMLRSKLDKVQVDLRRGTGVISVTLDPIQLRGGTYFAQAMIRDRSDSQAITETNSDWFYVAGSILTHNEINGVFEPNRSWHYVHVSEEFDEICS